MSLVIVNRWCKILEVGYSNKMVIVVLVVIVNISKVNFMLNVIEIVGDIVIKLGWFN